MLVAAFMGWPWVAVGLLVAGAALMATLDAVGNMTFMLAVHPTERPAMTSVYSTYRDVGEITVPGVFSVILRQFDLAAVFPSFRPDDGGHGGPDETRASQAGARARP